MTGKDYAGAASHQRAKEIAPGLYTPEAELAIIAAALCAPSEAAEVGERLAPQHFGEPVLSSIWEAQSRLLRAGRACSPPMIADAIGANEAFLEWGGVERLYDLTEVGTAHGLQDHAALVMDRAGKRALRALVTDVAGKLADSAAGDFTALVAELERRAGELAVRGGNADHFISAGDMVRRAIDYAKNRAGRIKYPFGVEDVDRFTNGMNAGEVTLLGARTGMGKTVGAMTVARAAAGARLGVCVYSLEMTTQHLGMRLACDIAYRRSAVAFSGITTNPTLDKALKDDLTPGQWEMLEEAQRIAANLPLYTDERSNLTMGQIEACTRRQHRRWAQVGIEPGPVIIDHLGKVKPSKDRRGNRTAEIADISNDCMQLAKGLGVPVLGLVQLNRQVEGRGEDKQPVLSDLRQAGELEEDARQVIFLYRPEYYLREGPPGESFEAESARREKLRKVEKQLFWIVEKNSHGPRGRVQTFCEIGCSAIRGWEA